MPNLPGGWRRGFPVLSGPRPQGLPRGLGVGRATCALPLLSSSIPLPDGTMDYVEAT